MLVVVSFLSGREPKVRMMYIHHRHPPFGRMDIIRPKWQLVIFVYTAGAGRLVDIQTRNGTIAMREQLQRDISEEQVLTGASL